MNGSVTTTSYKGSLRYSRSAVSVPESRFLCISVAFCEPLPSYDQGLIVLNPAASNGEISRVATIMPFAAAMAAMNPSDTPIERPFNFALAISIAYSREAGKSKTSILLLNRGKTRFSRTSRSLSRRCPSGSSCTPTRSSATEIVERNRDSDA